MNCRSSSRKEKEKKKEAYSVAPRGLLSDCDLPPILHPSLSPSSIPTMANTFGKRKRDEDSVLDGDVMLSGPMYDSDGEVDDEEDAPRSFGASSGKPIISLDEGVTFETGISGDEDEDDGLFPFLLL